MAVMVAVGLMGAALPLGAPPASAHSRNDYVYLTDIQSDTGQRSLHNQWMRWIPDETSLAELSIPGTHDSAAYQGGVGVRTHTMSLQNQLASGIRAWDIRVRHDSDTLFLYHGDFALLDETGRPMTLSDALQVARDFLARNPTETIIMRLGDAGIDHGGDNTRTEEEALNAALANETAVYNTRRAGNPEYIEASKQQDSDLTRIPTLGEVRGRIFVLTSGPGAGGIPEIQYDYGPKHADQRVQDEPTVLLGQIPQKWNLVRDHLVATNASNETGTLSFNHTSGCCGETPDAVAGGNPGETVQGINRRLFDYLGQRNVSKTGIIMMDFPGGRLISAIIAHNIRLITDPAVFETPSFEADLDGAAGFSGFMGAFAAWTPHDGGAAGRHRTLIQILQHFFPGQRLLSWVTADDGTSDWEAWALAAGEHDEHGYSYTAIVTEGRHATTNSEQLRATLQSAVNSLGSGASLSQRRSSVMQYLENTYDAENQQSVAVLIKKEPGGLANISYSTAITSARVDAHGFIHTAWIYDDPSPLFAEADGPYSVAEGSQIRLVGSATGGAGGYEYQWDADNDGVRDTAWGTDSTIGFTRDDDLSGEARLQVSDGTRVAEDTTQWSFFNVAPTAHLDGAAATTEGEPYSLTVTVTDPGADTFTGTIEWGDGRVDSDVVLTAGDNILTHTYRDGAANGSARTVKVTVTDDDGGVSDQATKAVSVTNAPPELTLVTPPFNVTEGEPSAMKLDLDDPGPDDSLDLTITWGDGKSTTVDDVRRGEHTFEHRYADNPSDPETTFTVVATLTDSDGAARDLEVEVGVSNRPPRLSVDDPRSIVEGDVAELRFELTDPGADTFLATVDWGDGTVDEQLSVHAGSNVLEHRYADNRRGAPAWPIHLVVFDDDGGFAQANRSVEVANADPTLEITAPTSVDEGTTLVLTLVAADPGLDDQLTAEIDWGDGSSNSIVDLEHGSNELNHVYVNPPGVGASAQRSISVTVRDGEGGTATGGHLLTVNNVAPTVEIFSDDEVVEGREHLLNIVVHDVGHDREFLTDINWGDGSDNSEFRLAPGRNRVDHTYADDAEPTITVTVTDEDGATTTVTTEVAVLNAVPSVRLEVEPVDEDGTATLTVVVDDEGLLDTFSGKVTWGDGQVDSEIVLTQGDNHLTHRYLDDPAGEGDDRFPLTVTVTDDDDGKSVSYDHLEVRNIAPTVAPIVLADPVGRRIGAGPDEVPWVLEGLAVELQTTFDDVGTLDTHEVSIDWGDGTIVAGGDTPVFATHTFATAGTFDVAVTVVDDDGGITTQQRTILVHTPAEAAAALADELALIAASSQGAEGSLYRNLARSMTRFESSWQRQQFVAAVAGVRLTSLEAAVSGGRIDVATAERVADLVLLLLRAAAWEAVEGSGNDAGHTRYERGVELHEQGEWRAAQHAYLEAVISRS